MAKTYFIFLDFDEKQEEKAMPSFSQNGKNNSFLAETQIMQQKKTGATRPH